MRQPLNLSGNTLSPAWTRWIRYTRLCNGGTAGTFSTRCAASGVRRKKERTLAGGCFGTQEFIVKIILFHQRVADGSLFDKELVIGKDSQHVIEAAAFDLSPIVITGGHDAVPLFEAVTAGGDGSIGGGNRACSAAVTGFLYFRAKKRYYELLLHIDLIT